MAVDISTHNVIGKIDFVIGSTTNSKRNDCGHLKNKVVEINDCNNITLRTVVKLFLFATLFSDVGGNVPIRRMLRDAMVSPPAHTSNNYRRQYR